MVTKADPARRLAAMAKMVPLMREHHEKLGALIEEFEAVTGGGPTIGDKLKHLEAYWSELWEARYSEPYVWPSDEYAKSRGQWKTLLKKLPIDALKRRIVNYFRNGEEFFRAKKHPFGLFVATINQHVNAPGDRDDLAQRPEGCKHEPACADQFEHTRRKQQEFGA
jgi:hypothetical protein